MNAASLNLGRFGKRVPIAHGLAVGTAMALLLFLLLHGEVTLLCTAVIVGALLVLIVFDRAAAIVCTFAYLLLMGDIRRLVSMYAGAPVNDPLLLVAPTIAVCLTLPLFLRLRLNDWLSKVMAALFLVMLMQIANPLQGGLAVGLSGAIFYIAPMLWFWVGRQYASPELLHRLLFRVVVPLSLCAAVLGLCQTFVGFLPWEQAWIDRVSKTYTALYLGNSIRAFGFSISAAEYGYLLAFGAACVFAAVLAGRKLWAVTLPLLLVAIVLVSSRGLIVKLALAAVVVWALRRGQALRLATLLRVALALALGFVLISFAAGHFTGGVSEGSSATQQALAHQAGGLAHPMDERYSTVGVHTSMMTKAIVSGITNPLGLGLGATTSAASRFGTGDTGSSEVDAADMFVSLGIVGGCLYGAAIVLILWHAMRYVQRAPRDIALAVVAMLFSTLGSWLIGGQYVISSMLFFCIGSFLRADDVA